MIRIAQKAAKRLLSRFHKKGLVILRLRVLDSRM
jgi:hypothetical protein